MLSKVKTENAISDRAIKQNKLAQNKKDEKHKAMRNERSDLVDQIDGVNKKIIETQWNYDVQLRKFNDPKLILNEQKKTHAYKQENSQCKLDIDIAESRRADLSAQVDMQNRQIEEILGEKREVEQQNAELEWKISGRGMTEADQK